MVAAELDLAVVVGHSIGGPLATIYAASVRGRGRRSVDAPMRVEPFAELLGTLALQLRGDGFDEVWSRLPAERTRSSSPPRAARLLRAGDDASQEVVLAYQADLLERPLEQVVRWRDEGNRRAAARARRPISPSTQAPSTPSERAWLLDRLPQAELVVWPVSHHFPHLAQPARLVALLTGLAAAIAGPSPC